MARSILSKQVLKDILVRVVRLEPRIGECLIVLAEKDTTDDPKGLPVLSTRIAEPRFLHFTRTRPMVITSQGYVPDVAILATDLAQHLRRVVENSGVLWPEGFDALIAREKNDYILSIGEDVFMLNGLASFKIGAAFISS
jgi:hypothetical protein